MHPAAKFGFERAVREFARWRAVERAERSPAPAWWWDPALAVLGQPEPMPAEFLVNLPCFNGSVFMSCWFAIFLFFYLVASVAIKIKGDAGQSDSAVQNPQGHLNPIPRSANASRNSPGIPESVRVKEIAERLAKLCR